MRLFVTCLVLLGCFETKAQEAASESISIEDAKPALVVGECAGFYKFMSEYFSNLDKKKSEFYQEIAIGSAIISKRLFIENGVNEELSHNAASNIARNTVIELDAAQISGDPDGLLLKKTNFCSFIIDKALNVVGK